jgi:hypothetical protein
MRNIKQKFYSKHGGYELRRESVVLTMIKGDYITIGLDADSTYKKMDVLLKLYRKINWCLEESEVELNDITYESCYGSSETMSYLLNFAPEKEMDVFRRRATAVMQTRVLLELIDRAVMKLRDYPMGGQTYYSIFDLKYLNRWTYTEFEILDMLDLERSTYYRKKKEGTYLLGYILFGYVMPDYIKAEKVANMCD